MQARHVPENSTLTLKERHNMAHEPQWIQLGVSGHTSGDGSDRLLTVEEYCAVCGQVAIHYQSAATCAWHRTTQSAVVIRDVDGEIGEPGAIIGSRYMTEAEAAQAHN